MPACYSTDEVARCAVGSPVTQPISSPCRSDLEGPPRDNRWRPIERTLFLIGASIVLWSAIIEGLSGVLGIISRLLSSS
jgi:hypothetical protein